MMVLYSRYLLLSFCRLFALTLGTFIAMVLVSRLASIAEFATLGVPALKLLEFTLMQIPIFLPNVAAISTLIATFLLIRRLSESGELTAFRSSGLSLWSLLFPILTVNAFLSIASFYVTSEIGTYTHRRTREMVKDVTGLNPILMLEHPSIAEFTGAFTRMDPIRPGKEVENIMLALPGRRITMLLIDKLKIVEGQLQGSNTTTLTSLPHNTGYDHLVIENLNSTYAPAVELATLLRKKGWKLAHDHLSWRLLSARERLLLKSDDGKAYMRLKKCKSEKIRRVAIALLPFSFALMGLAYGIEIQRRSSFKAILIVTLLALSTLIAQLIGKELDHLPLVALLLFFSPHIFINMLSFRKLALINRGAS